MKIDPQSFVLRNYLDFFHRLPDAAGDKFWVDQEFSQGKDQQHILRKSVDVARAFFVAYQPDIFDTNSSLKQGCNETFVKLCYVKLLGRNPDPEGCASWLNDLASYGNPAPQKGVNHLIEAFITCDEYQLRLADTVAPAIPEPSGKVVKVSEMNPKSTFAERLIAAESELGNAPGSILVDVQGSLNRIFNLRDGHNLHFTAGLWLFDTGLDESGVTYGDGCGVYGVPGKTIVLEPEFGYRMFSTFGSYQSDQGFSSTGITQESRVAGITCQGGRNQKPEGGVRSTFTFGNSRNCRIWLCALIDTACLGVTFGGTALTGNHAFDNIAEDNQFAGVGSQNLNVVNGSGNVFRRCSFKRTGKLQPDGTPWEGVSCIDLEPNVEADILNDNIVEDCWIDSSDSPFAPHGNGVIIQSGGALIENCNRNITRRVTVLGMRPDQATDDPLKRIRYRLAAGIMISGQKDAVLFDSEVFGTGQHGLYVGESDDAQVDRVKLISCGWDVQKAVEVFNSQRCNFNISTDIATNMLGRIEIVETGTSDYNVFTKSPGVVLKGKNSKIE